MVNYWLTHKALAYVSLLEGSHVAKSDISVASEGLNTCVNNYIVYHIPQRSLSPPTVNVQSNVDWTNGRPE